MLTCFPMLQREGITMSVARRTWRRGLRSTMPGMCHIRQNSALGTSTPLLPFAPKRRPSPLRPISKPIRVEPSPRGTSDSQSLRPVGLSASSIRKDCCDGLSLSTRGPKGSSIITLSLPSASSAPRPRRRASRRHSPTGVKGAKKARRGYAFIYGNADDWMG